jgi:RNA polymerase sigma factor (TIGR02999 family)
MLNRNGVTTLLAGVREGDEASRNRLFQLVYDELRRIAGGLMRRERPDHTLQTTALVNEAVLRLVGNLDDLQGSGHFYAAAARAMRRVLVDHAKGRAADKRGAGRRAVDLTAGMGVAAVQQDPAFMLSLDEALSALESARPRSAEAFSMWYFGGLTADEIARHFAVSTRTIQADLKVARVFVYDRVCS